MILLDLVFLGGAAAIWSATKAGTRRAFKEHLECKEADEFIAAIRETA